jgi:glycosyltransferase involved in cell wall biosynthesis
LRRYPHVRWISEPDKGQAHAINKGILMSTGEVIAYLNSDDVYRPGTFRRVASIFTDEPNTKIVVGNCDYINQTSQTIGFLKARYEHYEDLIRYWGWDKWICIPQQSVFIRRSVFSEIGLFNPRYRMVMDYDMWLRIASVYPFRIIDQTLSGFRLTENTKTVSRTYEMYLEELHCSRHYWKELSLAKWVPIFFAAYQHVGHKMLDVAEHYVFTFDKRRFPLRLLAIGISKWPPLFFNPRTCLTALQALVRHSRWWPSVCLIHRKYLRFVWYFSARSS